MTAKKTYTRPDTVLAVAGRDPDNNFGIVNPPVWRASTILYDNIAHLRATGAKDTHHTLFYGRRGTPTQWSLAEALKRVLDAGLHLDGAADHGVSEALYMRDPDGSLAMVTRRLDLEALLGTLNHPG